MSANNITCSPAKRIGKGILIAVGILGGTIFQLWYSATMLPRFFSFIMSIFEKLPG